MKIYKVICEETGEQLESGRGVSYQEAEQKAETEFGPGEARLEGDTMYWQLD